MAKLGDTVKGARVLSARVRAAEGADPEGRMSLIEHIRELRNRLLKICLALVAGTAIGLIPQVFTRCLRPHRAALLQGHDQRSPRLSPDRRPAGHERHLRPLHAARGGRVLLRADRHQPDLAVPAAGPSSRPACTTARSGGPTRSWAVRYPLFLGGALIAYFAMSRGLAYLLHLTPGSVINLPPVFTYLGLLRRHAARLRAGVRAAVAAVDAQRGRGARRTSSSGSGADS